MMVRRATSAMPGQDLVTYTVPMLQPTLEKAWFCQFCVGILICLNNGACFCFGIFSPYMKLGAFRYTQSQIDTVSTVGVLLSYFSMPTGFLYDRDGPAATLFTGAVVNVMGWLGMCIIFKDMEHPLLSNSVAVMAFFFGLSQLSASFYETGSMLTNLKSFSCYKGRVILIQKTFMGLGSSLVAQMYVAFFEKTFSSIAPFFLFLAAYSTVAGMLSVRYMRLPTSETRCVGLNVEDAETVARGGGEPRLFRRPFNVGSVLLCVCVAFILFTSLLENFVTLTMGVRLSIGVVTVALCASFTAMIFTTPNYVVNRHEPVVVVMREPSDVHAATDIAKTVGEDYRHESVIEELGEFICPAEAAPVPAKLQTPYGATDQHCSTQFLSPAAEPVPFDFVLERPVTAVVLNTASLWENLKHREMWLLWFVSFSAWSAMTVVSSNSSQIYEAIAADSFSLTVNTVFVSIYGVASAVGRIIVGFLHPRLERRQIPITVLLPLAPVLNILGLPFFLIAPAVVLFIPFFIVGLGVGFSWGCTVLIITSLFETNNCGKHYNFLYTAGMLSPLIFNLALFGPLYDHYGAKQGHNKHGTCEGTVCIAVPMLVCMAINIAAVPLAYMFYKRTEHRGILYPQ